MNARLFISLAALCVASSAIAAGADLGQAEKQATNWTAITMFGVFVAATMFITKWAAAKTKSAADFYTGGGGITPAKLNSGSGSASFSAYTTWSAQPTLGDTVWRFGVNANGGIDKFVAIPGAEIQVPVSGQLSIRSASGTSNVALNLLIEEVDG